MQSQRTLSRDLSYAVRTLRHSPLFTLAAVVTIALGIGASTAIFSVTNAVLLRPLPYRDSARLVLACSDMLRRNVKDFPFSDADFLDLRKNALDAFEDFAAVSTGRGSLPAADGTPEQVRFAAVSPNFFQMMGGRIAFGRDFQDSDGTAEPIVPQDPDDLGAAPPPPRLPTYSILSFEYFQRRFGGNPAILGHPLPVGGDGPAPIVVGVLSPGFELLFPPESAVERLPDVWAAARIPYDTASRNNVQWRAIGRLRADTTIEHAQEVVKDVANGIRRVNPIAKTAGMYIRLEPMQRHLVTEVRPAILALMGAVIFLLLIACANVANLMLVRASLRERDLAVRTALGAGRWDLIRQMLAEALVVAGLGTLAGLVLAWFGIQELLAVAPAGLPRFATIQIDPAALGFSVLAGLASAALFGMAPALRAARPDVMTVLRAAGRTANLGGGAMLRNGVVVMEVALCFVLLVGSGLMFRSFLAVQRVNTGFDARNLLVFQLVGPTGNNPEARAAFMRNVHDHLAALPGVRSVAASVPFPLAGGFSPVRWGTSEALTDAGKFQAADLQIVTPGYFETVRTPLLAGRTFTDADNAPDRNLLIVDQALAAKAFGRESAIGKRILFRVRTQEAQWGEIIGVVAHQRDVSLTRPGREQIYVTDGYLFHGIAGWWALRTAGDPAAYAALVRAEIRKAAPQQLISEIEPVEALVDKAQGGTRFSLLLIGLFAAIAVALAGVGLYGVLATVVRQRTAEIGVRMALGAAPAAILKMVVGHGLRLSLAGIGAGIIAAVGLTRLMTTMLVGVEPTDPLTYAAMIVLFLAIVLLASWLPAYRAAALAPAAALREE